MNVSNSGREGGGEKLLSITKVSRIISRVSNFPRTTLLPPFFRRLLIVSLASSPPSREEKEKAEIKRRLARDVGHENEFRPRRKLHEFGIHPRGGGDSEGGKCVYPDAKWICLGPVDTVTVVDECATFQTQFPRPCSGEGLREDECKGQSVAPSGLEEVERL